MQLGGLASRRAGKGEAWEEIGFRLPDPSRRGRHLSFGATDIRPPLQQVRRQANLDIRSTRWNRIGLLELTPQRAGFFSQENAQAMNRDSGSAEKAGDRGLRGIELRCRARYVEFGRQACLRSGRS